MNELLELHIEHGTPTTTNALESKNGIFKPLSRSARSFSNPQPCQSVFAGIALYENFDIKKREASTKVPVPCSGPKLTWMTSELLTFSLPQGCRRHKYLYQESQFREPSQIMGWFPTRDMHRVICGITTFIYRFNHIELMMREAHKLPTNNCLVCHDSGNHPEMINAGRWDIVWISF